MAEGKRVWWKSVIAYTLAGSLSSALVGTLLGVVGAWLQISKWRWLALTVVGLLAFILAAREWGLIKFPMPERRRQTERLWAYEFGFVGASALWGFHIGLAFATRVSYGGFWALVALILALGSPGYGMTMMLVYWLGRVLPVWLAPGLDWSGSDTSQLLIEIVASDRVYHRLSGIGLVWSGGIALLLAMNTLVAWSWK